jgi:2-polyprenyl-3-methyl-5-hydroxy-6-metoxy-1,4-benzoquinol methylase
MDVRGQMDRIYSELPAEEIPWHMATPPPALVEVVESGRVAPCRAVDLGCGAGNHAVWLALHGFDVTGLELSAAAVTRAQELARSKGAGCRFAVVDLLRGLRPPACVNVVPSLCLPVLPAAETAALQPPSPLIG